MKVTQHNLFISDRCPHCHSLKLGGSCPVAAVEKFSGWVPALPLSCLIPCLYYDSSCFSNGCSEPEVAPFFFNSFRCILFLGFPLTAFWTSSSPEHPHAIANHTFWRRDEAWTQTSLFLVLCSVTLWPWGFLWLIYLLRKQHTLRKLFLYGSVICEKKGSYWWPSSFKYLRQVPRHWFSVTVALH